MMGGYTEQELLLLSNFAYIPACLSNKPISEILDAYRNEDGTFTPEGVTRAAAGGGMSTEDVATVFSRMDMRIQENPDFGMLSASRRLEEADVRAICYTNPKDEDPVVVFRGTGGTEEAWSDNFEGAFYEDTRIQTEASDFIKYECGIYNEMVVTGHSKGGNMAMYTTVKNPEKITSCVSFDGQGFGDDFINDNPELIAEAAPKIKSISAYNDFVNILLTCISGTCIYVENGPSAEDAHSSVTLLTKNTFDEAGNFTSIRDRGAISGLLDAFTERMCDKLEPLDIKEKEMLGKLAGETVSHMLCTPPDKVASDCAAPLIGAIAGKFIKSVTACVSVPVAEVSLAAEHAQINLNACNGAAKLLSEQIPAMERIVGSIDSVRRDLAYTMSSKICAEYKLNGTCESIIGISEIIGRFSDLVSTIIRMYEKVEEEAAGLMNF